MFFQDKDAGPLEGVPPTVTSPDVGIPPLSPSEVPPLPHEKPEA